MDNYNKSNLEVFLNYLESSSFKYDLGYVIIIIVLVVVLVSVLVAFKKFGVYDSVIDIIRAVFGKDPVSIPRKEEKEEKTKIVYVEKAEHKVECLNDIDMGRGIKSIQEYNNVKLSIDEINTIKRLKAEKRRLKEKLNELKETNEDLTKQLNVTNRELELLKIDKHPDLLIFEHFLESLKTYLTNYFKNIIEINHLVDKQDHHVFSEYLYKVFNETKEHVHVLIDKFKGVLFDSLYEVIDKVSLTKMLIKGEEELLYKLRDIAIEHHAKSQKNLLERNKNISKELNNVLRKNAKNALEYLKTDVQMLNSEKTVDQLAKKFPSDEFFVIISNAEIEAIEAFESIRISQKEQQLKEANEFVEFLALQIESKYKEKLIMEIFQQIQLGQKQKQGK